MKIKRCLELMRISFVKRHKNKKIVPISRNRNKKVFIILMIICIKIVDGFKELTFDEVDLSYERAKNFY